MTDKKFVQPKYGERGNRGGWYRTKVYNTWYRMLKRCNNKKYKDWKKYGAIGITVCKRWMKFENFLHDMGEPPSSQHSIDRINNDLGYSKNNCRWATKREQIYNRKCSVRVIYKNKEMSLHEYCQLTGRCYSGLYLRTYYTNMTAQEAICIGRYPLRYRRKKKK